MGLVRDYAIKFLDFLTKFRMIPGRDDSITFSGELAKLPNDSVVYHGAHIFKILRQIEPTILNHPETRDTAFMMTLKLQ